VPSRQRLVSWCLTIALVALAVLLKPVTATARPSAAVTPEQIIATAQAWVTANVPYSQSETYNGYRKDCSGLVSAAWGLPIPGLTTASIPTFAEPITKDELSRGDILNNTGEHVVIFDSWTDGNRTHYNAYEETPAYDDGGAHYTMNIPYPYWPGYSQSYVPMRLKGLMQSGGEKQKRPEQAGAQPTPKAQATPKAQPTPKLRPVPERPTPNAERTAKAEPTPKVQPTPKIRPVPERPTPTPSQQQKGSISPNTAFDISSGPPGSTPNLDGWGFYPNKDVTVTESGPAGSRTVGVVKADASGSFNMTFQIGDRTPEGQITFTFRQKPNVKATDTFYVTACRGCPIKPDHDQSNTKKNAPSTKPTAQPTAPARKVPSTKPSETATSSAETTTAPVPWATLAPEASSAPETTPSANR
jgi:hypothetical protein